jgi:hypothetical protein
MPAKITVVTGGDIYVEEEAAFVSEQLRGDWLVRLNAGSGGGVWVNPANVVSVEESGEPNISSV